VIPLIAWITALEAAMMGLGAAIGQAFLSVLPYATPGDPRAGSLLGFRSVSPHN